MFYARYANRLDVAAPRPVQLPQRPCVSKRRQPRSVYVVIRWIQPSVCTALLLFDLCSCVCLLLARCFFALDVSRSAGDPISLEVRHKNLFSSKTS